MFGENEIFELNQDCVNSDHDGEKVILDISSGTYYKANATASEILKILESPKSFNDIKNIISQRYPSKDNSIASDLKNFLKQVLNQNYLSKEYLLSIKDKLLIHIIVIKLFFSLNFQVLIK